MTINQNKAPAIVGDKPQTELAQSDSGELERALDEVVKAAPWRGDHMFDKNYRDARKSVLDLFERLLNRIAELERLETYVCQVIAMGNQADLTVESLPR